MLTEDECYTHPCVCVCARARPGAGAAASGAAIVQLKSIKSACLISIRQEEKEEEEMERSPIKTDLKSKHCQARPRAELRPFRSKNLD